jgi:hypothetical protein
MHRPVVATHASDSKTIPLILSKGTAVEVILDKEIRIQRVGQPIHGRVAEPVYAFDKLVVPVGTDVTGQITRLEKVAVGKRILDALNADLTPSRKVQIEFNDLQLANGQHLPIRTSVIPGSGQVIRFISAVGDEKKKGIKGAASDQAKQAKEEAKKKWDAAMKQVHEPGKLHKLVKYCVAQLPVHPQYIDAETVFFAELEKPLDFGTEILTAEAAASLDLPPAHVSSVHVRLGAELDSATTQKGEAVEAIFSQPLFEGSRLILPQGSQLKGSVVEVRPARRFHRNGQLRIGFNEIALPDGMEQKVEANLEGVQGAKEQNLKLDSEGGAEANSSKKRYLSAGISVTLALASSRGDPDARNGDVGGNTSNRVAGGVGGFKVVGLAVGAFVHSQPLGMAMGVYGATLSVYSHFIARGREVLLPKNTPMDVAIGQHSSSPGPAAKPVATRIREPGSERTLGRKSLEIEILKNVVGE